MDLTELQPNCREMLVTTCVSDKIFVWWRWIKLPLKTQTCRQTHFSPTSVTNIYGAKRHFKMVMSWWHCHPFLHLLFVIQLSVLSSFSILQVSVKASANLAVMIHPIFYMGPIFKAWINMTTKISIQPSPENLPLQADIFHGFPVFDFYFELSRCSKVFDCASYDLVRFESFYRKLFPNSRFSFVKIMFVKDSSEFYSLWNKTF